MNSFQIITIGTSLGGLDALSLVLGGLPSDFPLPLAVVQHRSVDDSEGIVPLLAENTRLRVCEVEDKDSIELGWIYIGPPNYHLIVERNYFALSEDPPVMSARPSIDVLFESAADVYGEGVIGILLTGMGRDGSEGVKKIKDHGGFVIVQDPAPADGAAMPEAALSTTAVDKVLELSEIAPLLVQLCEGKGNIYAGR